MQDFDLETAINRIDFFSKSGAPIESAWYGFDELICQWAELPCKVPIMYNTHHFVENKIEPCMVDVHKVKEKFVGRRAYAELYEKHGIKAHVTGSPYMLYRTLNKIEQAQDACGTIVYPGHSSQEINANYDIQGYIKQLKALPEKFHPIVISMYWRDIERGLHQPYLDANLQVVTAGHLYDGQYTKNFYNIIRQFKYAFSNFAMGSAITLALDLGLEVFLLGKIDYTVVGKDPTRPSTGTYNLDYIMQQSNDPIADEFLSLLPHYNAGTQPANIKNNSRLAEIVRTFLGYGDADDKGTIREAIYRGCYINNPAGQFVSQYVLGRPELFNDKRYEKAYEGIDELLTFCRVIDCYPELKVLIN